MAGVQSPRLFGWEGVVYWNASLFPVSPPTKYEPTAPEISTWFSGATVSNDVINVSVAASNELVELTPRAHANRGWRTTFTLPTRITVGFAINHQEGTGSLVHALINAWQGVSEIAMAFMDKTSGGDKGVIGNFGVSMSKDETLRQLQIWQVSVEPKSYVDYYQA